MSLVLESGLSFLRVIPVGYIPLEYIESIGQQFIRTGFYPNQDTRVVCDFQFTVVPDGHWGVFGARNGSASQSQQYCFGYTNNSIFRTDYNQTRIPYGKNAFDTLARHTVDKNKNVTSLDGVILTHNYEAFNPNNELALFGINTSGTVANLSSAKIYSCQIYDNGRLVRDFIPCINLGGEAGLYDTVNQVFYKNAGTDSFKYQYNNGYKRLDYIEFDGTKYIILDLPFTKDTVCRVKFNMKEHTGNCIVGSGNAFRFFNAGYGAYLDWARGSGGGRINGGSIKAGTLYDIEFGDWYVKNLETGTNIIAGTPWVNTVSYNNDPIKLMWAGPLNPNVKGKGKIYLLQIYENGNIVRNLLPFINSIGEVGLYDSITNKFYAIIDTTTASTMTREGGIE